MELGFFELKIGGSPSGSFDIDSPDLQIMLSDELLTGSKPEGLTEGL
jgi:hypothetical protein